MSEAIIKLDCAICGSPEYVILSHSLYKPDGTITEIFCGDCYPLFAQEMSKANDADSRNLGAAINRIRRSPKDHALK